MGSFRYAMAALRASWLALPVLALAAWGAGCDGGGADAATPGAGQVAQIQKSGDAGLVVDQAIAAASESVVDDGSGSAVTQSKPEMDAPSASPAALVFNFQNNRTLTVDLATLVKKDGTTRRYPNTTGTIQIVANGSVVSSGTQGSVDYAATVTALTPIVYTNPNTGAAGDAEGASISGLLCVTALPEPSSTTLSDAASIAWSTTRPASPLFWSCATWPAPGVAASALPPSHPVPHAARARTGRANHEARTAAFA
jgi:hypothetical protein